jgi:hypothetical protein
MRPSIRLMNMPNETNFAPLGVLGYCLTRSNCLWPTLTAVHLPLKAVDHTPASKLLDVLVSILAGCRAISQVNTRLRPDQALARAWSRTIFADQSSLSRTLDSFTDQHVQQLRQASALLFRRESQTLRHPFGEQRLWLDVDLTPLPASKHAEASTKGKISPKKTPMVGNWHVCMRRSITKRSSHNSTPASSKVHRPMCQCSKPSNATWACRRRRRLAPSCAPTVALGVIVT